MKKLLYSLLTLAAALTVASCQQELEGGSDPALGGPTVKAELTLDLRQVPTKAYADGSNATVISYAFFDETGTAVESLSKKNVTLASLNSNKIEVKLSKGAAYTFVAWAESPSSIYTISENFKTVTMKTTELTANNNAYDAFYGTVTITADESKANVDKSVTLKRPFAQLNLLVPDANAESYSTFKSSLTVKDAHTGMNLLDGSLTDAKTDLAFAAADVDLNETSLKTGYKYLAMNYVFAGTEAANYVVSMTITPDEKDAEAAVVGTSEKPLTVSLKRNRRTNLVGNIFATEVDGTITIVIDPNTGDDQDQDIDRVEPDLTITIPGGTTDGTSAVNLPLTLGTSANISMTSSNSTGAVSFDQAADTDVATVADNGDGTATVKPVADGTTTFVAHIGEGPTKATANAKDVTFNVVVGDGVKKGTQTLVFKLNDTAVTETITDVDEKFEAPVLSGALTTVTYAIDPANDDEVMIDADKGNLVIDETAAAGKTYTVTATAAEGTVEGIKYAAATASYTFTVKAAAPAVNYGSGTLEDPYTVAGVIAYIDGASYDADAEVYVAGVVSDLTQYTFASGTASFWLTADGDASEVKFEAYKLGYLGGNIFAAGNPDIAVGNSVILYGKVTNYQGTYETTQNAAYLYSLDGKTAITQKPTITGAGDVTVVPAGDGTLEITLASEDGATTYYTTDDTAPSNTSTQYSAPFTISAACTIKAISYKDGKVSSAIASKSFTKDDGSGAGTNYATIETSNVTLTAGTNGSAAEVNGNAAIKVGSSSKGGDMSVTVPAGTTKLHLHAAAWNGVSNLSLNLTGAICSPASISLSADTGIANSSPFTLAESPEDFYFEITLSGIEAETTITFTSATAKRFVVWGVNAE